VEGWAITWLFIWQVAIHSCGLYEAAAIDGSDGISKHWDITVPLMKPYLVLVAISAISSATKVFEEVYIMTQGGPHGLRRLFIIFMSKLSKTWR